MIGGDAAANSGWCRAELTIAKCGQATAFWRELSIFWRDFARTAPHLHDMKRKTANIDIRVEPELVEKVDAWRARQRVLPSRSAAVVYMLEYFLKHDTTELRRSSVRA